VADVADASRVIELPRDCARTVVVEPSPSKLTRSNAGIELPVLVDRPFLDHGKDSSTQFVGSSAPLRCA